MVKLSKNRKAALDKMEAGKKYTLKEASSLIKEITTTKFDATIDLNVRLGVDPRKANQMVRGSVTLPHGTGQDVKVLVLCTEDKAGEVKEAGADMVGLDEYLTKFDQGWTDADVIITSPDVMPKLGKYGKLLGPRGLMPNPKTGTVTTDLAGAVKQTKAGKIDFKVDRYGIVHTVIGKASFSPEAIFDNALEILQSINKLKPAAAKGVYMKNVSMSSSMSPGIDIDSKNITAS